jgi:hypothetical protein
MSAPQLLADLTAAGFTLTAQGGSLVVSPSSRLTDAQRAAVRTHRADLLALVTRRDARAAHAARVARLVGRGWDRRAAADVAQLLAVRDGTDNDRDQSRAGAERKRHRPARRRDKTPKTAPAGAIPKAMPQTRQPTHHAAV